MQDYDDYWSEQQDYALLLDDHEKGWHDRTPLASCPDCMNEQLSKQAERDMRNHPNKNS